MCRIAGIVNRCLAVEHASICAMLKSMSRGGPDDEGIFLDGNVCFGHRRLSIIDTSKAGHQPMLDSRDEIVISFNGEIYNYLQLRKELEVMGVCFKSNTDTEIIIYCYKMWGVEAFKRFEGIFSFAIFDRSKNKILLVRDFPGVKPLYYFFDDDSLIFASEVRAFKKFKPDWKINEDWKIIFLAFGSMPHPYTTMYGVFSIDPGSYVELDLHDFRIEEKKFDHSPVIQNCKNYEEALKRVKECLVQAVKKNLVSDVPLGVFLSGGIDSSLITLLANKEIHNSLKTVSINFDETSLNEEVFQRMIVNMTGHADHKSQTLTAADLTSVWDDFLMAMDQPSIDGVNSYFVSKFASQSGLKVVLSGIGADELFGGYASFKRIKSARLISKLPFKKYIARFLGLFSKTWDRISFLELNQEIGFYLFLRGIHSSAAIAKILDTEVGRVQSVLNNLKLPQIASLKSDYDVATYLETNVYMRNQLLRDTDVMSMWHGLEVRVPFLDQKLVYELKQIDTSLFLRGKSAKSLLTSSFSEILPTQIVLRKKQGFVFPFAKWLIQSEQFFDRLLPQGGSVNQIKLDFKSGSIHWSRYWSLIILNQFR